ncbi:hypothetical protein [Methylobacterium sp. Leaf465]|uniref:hypothetical protein n=1 Tax=Methylobacterium sp. Leaf465 TaxID=1736385 RepID=UPI000A4CF047|nr:hypothetical protein [Methylobacterium sp. Leaf465]
MADHTKFTRRPMVEVGRLAQIDALFTDRPPPPEIVALMERHGVKLALTGSGGVSQSPDFRLRLFLDKGKSSWRRHTTRPGGDS